MANVSNILAALGVGSMAVGALTGSVSAYRGAKADRQAARWQADVQRNNAQIAEWEARDALERGADEVQRHQLKVADLKSTQRASFASRGILLSEGSPLRILTDTDFLGELDANVIRRNAAREATSHRNRAATATSNAELLDYQADEINPLMAGTTALLNGVTSVASKWYAYRTGASGYQVGRA